MRKPTVAFLKHFSHSCYGNMFFVQKNVKINAVNTTLHTSPAVGEETEHNEDCHENHRALAKVVYLSTAIHM